LTESEEDNDIEGGGGFDFFFNDLDRARRREIERGQSNLDLFFKPNNPFHSFSSVNQYSTLPISILYSHLKTQSNVTYSTS
jgi:hypothetical protein